MRIGILANIGEHLDCFYPSIVDHLRSEGHSVFPACGSATRNLSSETLRAVTRNPSLRSILAFSELPRWAARHRLDVVLTNTATPSALARLAPRMPPVVYFAHGLHWADEREWKSAHWRVAERLLLPRTAGVICLNSEDEQWLRRRAKLVPVKRLGNGVGVEIERFPRSPNRVQPNGLKLVWIGEFSERKDPHSAIDVFKELSRQVPVELRMLGQGPLRESCIARVSSETLGGTIAFPGKVPVEEHLRWSNLLLHTSYWEGLPRVTLEAASVGRPTMAFPAKGLRERPEVHLAAERSPSSLAQSILEWYRQNVSSTYNGDFSPRSNLSTANAAQEIAVFLEDVLDDQFAGQ